MKSVKLIGEIRENFINEYSNTDITIVDICKKYNISTMIFYTLKKKINLQKNVERAYIKECNSNFFEKLDHEKNCYWAGFILGDGHITDYSVKIRLSIKDYDHLVKFKDDIECDYEITTGVTYTKLGNESKFCNISVSRKKICKDLTNKGISKNKSYVCCLPIISDDLMHHFIRGLFDADGSFSIYKNNARFSMYSSTKYILFQIQKVLIEKCKLNITKIIKLKNNQCYSLTYGGNTQVKKIMLYLYKDAMIKLDRKYELFINHYKSLGYENLK